jgi:hypothetical protein
VGVPNHVVEAFKSFKEQFLLNLKMGINPVLVVPSKLKIAMIMIA